MKTCKGAWIENEFWNDKIYDLFRFERKDLFDAVPLSEFEAYKQKTKQAIEKVRKEISEYDDYNIVNLVLDKFKKELEL